MTIWRNDIERDAFIESNCDRCFQPDQAKLRTMGVGEGCPHLITAEKNKTALPKPWTRRRNSVIGETFKCDDYMDKPAVNRRRSAPADTVSMFDDLEPEDRFLVPVENWPDYAALERERKRKADHD